ncbi:hypothetical protein [Persephonella sp.]
MKIYFFAFILLLFQMSVVSRIFSIENTIPDFLTIFLIIYTLRNNLKDSLKLSIFIGLLQDIFSPTGLLFNTLTKTAVVFTAHLFKEKFFYSGIFVQSLIVAAVTAVDIGIKSSILFLKTGILDISYQYVLYLIMNFTIFYAVALADELR